MDLINEIQKQIDADGKIYQVAVIKQFDIIDVVIDSTKSITIPAMVNNSQLKFENDFIITDIITRAETDALAGFLLEVAGFKYPSITYLTNTTKSMESQALGVYTLGFYCSTTENKYANLNIDIKHGNLLKFLCYNANAGEQFLYIKLIGYKIFNRVLKQLI